jgi:hypothetical protein
MLGVYNQSRGGKLSKWSGKACTVKDKRPDKVPVDDAVAHPVIDEAKEAGPYDLTDNRVRRALIAE